MSYSVMTSTNADVISAVALLIYSKWFRFVAVRTLAAVAVGTVVVLEATVGMH